MKNYILLKIFSKKVIKVALITFFFVFNKSLGYSQGISDSLFFEKIVVALQKADASGISEYVYNKVDITLPNQNGIFSKYQVKLLLEDFFQKNKPDTFVFSNRYKKTDEMFIVGNYKTHESQYRVCFLTKTIDNKNYIYQIRIEK